mmetsp:Transcript_14043/g.36326  ORF Transcript_14043/g.36326 Transcript_14043/m.36326 type:complete len:267 (-) Transcript_14043:138-938(-)
MVRITTTSPRSTFSAVIQALYRMAHWDIALWHRLEFSGHRPPASRCRWPARSVQTETRQRKIRATYGMCTAEQYGAYAGTSDALQAHRATHNCAQLPCCQTVVYAPWNDPNVAIAAAPARCSEVAAWLVQSNCPKPIASIAAENAANPAQPMPMACGPACAARTAPQTHPPRIGFHRSVRPRVFSTMHSEHENTAPMTNRFLPHDLLCDAISFAPRRICSFNGKFCASSDCTLDWKGARMTPSPSPRTPPAPPAMMDCMTQFSRPA